MISAGDEWPGNGRIGTVRLTTQHVEAVDPVLVGFVRTLRSCDPPVATGKDFGVKEPWLDAGHTDPERVDLPRQCFGEDAERVFARRIEAAVWRSGDASSDRGDVDNHSAALCTHRRQRGLKRAHRTPDVGVIHGHRLLQIDRLDRSAATDAGVVDEHVDGAMVGLNRADRGSYRVIIGDVELYHFDVEPLHRVARRLGGQIRLSVAMRLTTSSRSLQRPMTAL